MEDKILQGIGKGIGYIIAAAISLALVGLSLTLLAEVVRRLLLVVIG